jgi:hypothetical protein
MGYSRHYLPYCQWDGCDVGAVRFVRRGERMDDLTLCTEHARAFHELSDAEAFRVSDGRQPRRLLKSPPPVRGDVAA